ncbi:hypothetical protein E2E30_13300 [Sphingomonas sp. AAP5]|uniref:hypothetical protein n=1 Tax=Sphingomonas sp. AAP5 TaxID=1523415 RepID=UPI0010572930|nr:hypothetical protein [Sphingomonas sp. AAP5]QBM76635.1 hypothetical protein E2E30_13300 [Sphingomonas sp. AAP5]
MQMILVMVGAIGLVVTSLLAAALLCWFLWYGFRLVLHPEWGAPAILTLLVLALLGELPTSEFLHMTLAFAVVAAAPLWFAGCAWRKQRRPVLDAQCEKRGIWPSAPTAPAETVLSPRLYPAITACICEERPPTRDEIHVVASRLWREGFAQRFGSQTVPASFAARRVLLRAATAALGGKVVYARAGSRSGVRIPPEMV